MIKEITFSIEVKLFLLIFSIIKLNDNNIELKFKAY